MKRIGQKHDKGYFTELKGFKRNRHGAAFKSARRHWLKIARAEKRGWKQRGSEE